LKNAQSLIIDEGEFHVVATVGAAGNPLLSKSLIFPAVTGYSFARGEGRSQEVLDILAWNSSRIKSLITEDLNDEGRNALVSELMELESEINTIQMVQHPEDEIHESFKKVGLELSRIRARLELKVKGKRGRKRKVGQY
jgi:hypothetical protein